MKRLCFWCGTVGLCVLALAVTSGAQEDTVLQVPGEYPTIQVIRVPGDFSTIQQAVDAAAPGDTISVAPGTYCEQVVISTAGLRLRAAPAGDNKKAILSGACADGGYGFHVLGTSLDNPVSDVEITGFVVEGFDSGIVLQNAMGSRVRLNEVRENVYRSSTTPAYGRSQGIVLVAASLNEITENWSHDNGHLGIGLFNGSNTNLVRGNRLIDNRGACALMLWGTTNSGNRLVENEVRGEVGYGIMVGPGIQAWNLVAQNRIHGYPLAGIVVNPGSYSNAIMQNDARRNGLDGGTDLTDFTTTNLWLRNRGTCAPGNAGCE